MSKLGSCFYFSVFLFSLCVVRCRRFCLYTECCRNDLILQWSLYFSLVDVNLTRLHPRHRNTNRKLQGSTTPLQGLEVPM
ncbi:Hypothetical predicted protein [Podarcis lilfordi]|uniref:Secreted protein n=1 Tax=Podarcis lilfordi TaxID=74358 RepID=A0AA35JWI5_9SAUR|nr:Hypothetical predicted protein [Podarcis lilfordi]